MININTKAPQWEAEVYNDGQKESLTSGDLGMLFTGGHLILQVYVILKL